MAAAVVIALGGREVTVRELTVGEVRAWVAEIESGVTVDVIGSMVFEDCALADLVRMSDMTVTEMDGLGQSDLAALRDKCRALNPHFFKVREALQRVSRAMETQADSLLSTAPSAL